MFVEGEGRERGEEENEVQGGRGKERKELERRGRGE